MDVSWPFLIGLLQAGAIEYRAVRTHRRIKAESLMEYIAGSGLGRLRIDPRYEVPQQSNQLVLVGLEMEETAG